MSPTTSPSAARQTATGDKMTPTSTSKNALRYRSRETKQQQHPRHLTLNHDRISKDKSKSMSKNRGRKGVDEKVFRRSVMEDTIRQSPDIISNTPSASNDSFFHDKQLLPLTENPQLVCPQKVLMPVRVIKNDTLVATRHLMQQRPEYTGRVAVLNMASDVKVAGNADIPHARTQEDALCLSSTLYPTLDRQRRHYPWKRTSGSRHASSEQPESRGIYSPGVVIFKDSSANDFVELTEEERRVVGVISVAAPKNNTGRYGKQAASDLVDTKLEELRESIRLMGRMAAGDGKTVLVLGAMGCGAYGCPARQVATTMKDIIVHGDEFRGWFEEIIFVIYSQATCDVFRQVLEA